MIGSLVKNSGFEDLVYQAELCTSGSLQGVLVGSHYNRAWAVQRVVSESSERLFLVRFLTETKPDIPNLMEEFVTDPKPQMVDETLMNANKKLHDHYETFQLLLLLLLLLLFIYLKLTNIYNKIVLKYNSLPLNRKLIKVKLYKNKEQIKLKLLNK